MVRRPAVVALFLVGVLAMLGGCYDAPKPVCGFYCGPGYTCPDDYSCQRGRCILNSAIPTLDLDNLGDSCELVDAGMPPPDDVELFDVPVGPTVVDHMPGDLEDDVAVDASIMVTFSEPVTQVVAGSISVVEQSPFSPFIEGTLTQPTATTAVFTPTEPLAMGAAYTVSVSSPITDLDGVPLQFTQWSFKTVPDTVPPTVVEQTPAPDATDVPIDATVWVTFSERVSGVDGSTFVVRIGGQQVSGSAIYDDVTHTATFQPSGRLLPNTTYSVALSGAITDRGNNPLAGAPITWTFTTGPDTIAPQVTSRNPLPGMTNVDPSVIVVAVFDEEVVNVTNATFTLRAGTTVIPSTVSYFAGAAQAQLRPDAQLGSNVTYTVTLDPAITDAAGNALTGAPISWTFTTRPDLASPAVMSRSPFPGSNTVRLDAVVTATFNEEVANVNGATFTLSGGITGTVSYTSGSRVATFVPSTLLAPGTSYTATLLDTITDLAGNPLPLTQWTFTTVSDATPPTSMLTTPLDGATDVATTTSIVVLFDEPVTGISGATFRVSAPSGVGGMITSAMGGAEYTFTPFMPLPAGTTVTVSLTSGITDNTGNALVPVTYSFTTAP